MGETTHHHDIFVKKCFYGKAHLHQHFEEGNDVKPTRCCSDFRDHAPSELAWDGLRGEPLDPTALA
jgi:hypothetical protein